MHPTTYLCVRYPKEINLLSSLGDLSGATGSSSVDSDCSKGT